MSYRCSLTLSIHSTIAEKSHLRGNFFTMFLHCPLMAFCHICEISEIQHALWERCQTLLDNIWQVIATNIANCPTLGMCIFYRDLHVIFVSYLSYKN